MVHQNYQNLIELTSNIFIIIAFVVGFKCPRKIHFMAAAAGSGYKPVALNMRPFYDHSYYFISTFMRDHIDFHARALLCFPAHSECKSLY